MNKSGEFAESFPITQLFLVVQTAKRPVNRVEIVVQMKGVVVPSDAIAIGIAVVEHDGCYLVGVRGDDRPMAGMSEFPGGKCRPDEPACECAVRECREETGLEVQAVVELQQTIYCYEHATVDLHFWLCRPQKTATVQTGHAGFVWLSAGQLQERNFPEANASVLEIIAARWKTADR